MRLQQQKADSRKAAPNELEEIEKAFRALTQEEERVIEAYRLKILSPEQLAREMDKLKARKAALEARKASITQQTDLANQPDMHRSLKDYCKLASKRMRTFNQEERQRFLRLLIHKVIYTGSSVRIKGAIPIQAETTDTAPSAGDPTMIGADHRPVGLRPQRSPLT